MVKLSDLISLVAGHLERLNCVHEFCDPVRFHARLTTPYLCLDIVLKQDGWFRNDLRKVHSCIWKITNDNIRRIHLKRTRQGKARSVAAELDPPNVVVCDFPDA